MRRPRPARSNHERDGRGGVPGACCWASRRRSATTHAPAFRKSGVFNPMDQGGRLAAARISRDDERHAAGSEMTAERTLHLGPREVEGRALPPERLLIGRLQSLTGDSARRCQRICGRQQVGGDERDQVVRRGERLHRAAAFHDSPAERLALCLARRRFQC